MPETTELRLSFIVPDADEADVEYTTRQLREEILNLKEVESATFYATGEAPTGAKAGDVITWGTLLVTLAASGGVLTTLIGTLNAWLSRDEKRTLKVTMGGDTLELTGGPAEERQRVIHAWLEKHDGSVVLPRDAEASS